MYGVQGDSYALFGIETPAAPGALSYLDVAVTLLCSGDRELRVSETLNRVSDSMRAWILLVDRHLRRCFPG